MADNKHICVFDFETGGRNPHECEIIQIGALILHRSSFKVLDRFESLMQPKDFDALSQEALDVNGITVEQLKDAPVAAVVFPTWIEWITQFNTVRDNSIFGAPVPCGYNITGFDLVLMDRYCKEYNYWDEKYNRQNVMFPMNRIDVFDLMWLFTRFNSDITKRKLVSYLEYMGITKEEIEEGSHNAGWDVEMTAKIAIKFLKWSRQLTEINMVTGRRHLDFKDCFKETVTNG